MKTETKKTKKINWLFPLENTEDVDITVKDFRKMVHKAEKDEGMTLLTYKEKMDAWWQKHL